ncbi:glycoside hydrolase family 5 protein [Xylariaceae sp. FL0594]|nr:glycoside hydrolase family 5 protein [Xylariaceae sp. FL0594]
MRKTTLAYASGLLGIVRGAAALNCAGRTFQPISAADYVAAMNPGWNLGNTLDATPTEGSWNNAPVKAETFAEIKKAGFKSVRIPVTYAYHFTGSSPGWEIDPAWLKRVSDVVDMAVDAGLCVLTNVHHDSYRWADISASGANWTAIEERMYQTWFQIGTALGCKSSRVAFEPINEPPIDDEEQAAELNKINGLFLKALKDSGGFNAKRVVTLAGPGMDALQTSQWFQAPTGYENPWALQYHYYSPYDFIFGAWGKTILTESDIAEIEADMEYIRGNFTDVPLVLGEFDASPADTEPAARRKWMDVVVRKAHALNTSVIVWDNGADHFNRVTKEWNDPHSVQIIMNAAKGVSNSLSKYTIDDEAPEQESSAYVFYAVGKNVTDQSVEIELNGNKLKGIKTGDGVSLRSGIDYTANSAGKITFKSSFLAKYFADQTPGIKANLTLSFSAGATAGVQLVTWSVPQIKGPTTSVASPGSDLRIPVQWAGVGQPAAVKMARADGVYLFSDWARWLGPLQHGRGTFSSQWNWDGDDLILTAETVDAVVEAGVETVFTFEFFPRVEGNAVNYTLTVGVPVSSTRRGIMM